MKTITEILMKKIIYYKKMESNVNKEDHGSHAFYYDAIFHTLMITKALYDSRHIEKYQYKSILNEGKTFLTDTEKKHFNRAGE